MQINFAPFDTTGRARITQLINKSNQFNLTTKRYNELEVKNFEDNPIFYTRQIRLRDTLGDNGMISVIICKKNLEYWEIDTWLMSCRVLGREVEEAALQDIVSNAKDSGVIKLIGIYNPTVRNIIVKDHYKKLGFKKKLGKTQNEVWELDIANYKFKQVPMHFKYTN